MITIVDFGIGNLRSLAKAVEHLGAENELTGDPELIARAEKLLLPGDAHFGDAMREITSRGLTDPLLAYARTGRPLLGICVGMQVLMDSSEEAPGVAGLGLIPGTVRRFQTQLKVPHMGWNTVRQVQPACPLFRDIPDQSYYYFIHSYYVSPSEAGAAAIAGVTDYSLDYPSILCRDNVMATQFHPEKSQRWGLKLLENFLAM
jgi:imidazole glycerol phosphate synthase glutamine amidotransferase subunit